MRSILVVASTFPSTDTDPVPAFVRDQIIAMKRVEPDLKFTVLAPHDQRSHTTHFSSHDAYDEYRFHYFLPPYEKLAGRGIMPALKENLLNYLLIPFLFIGEFFAVLRLIRRTKPDVIYAHWFTPQVVTTRMVTALTRTPFVFTTHASDVAVWHKIPLIGTPIVRSGTRRAQAFTAVSRRSMDKLRAFFPDKEWGRMIGNHQIIPMGVDMPKVKQPKGDANTILFVGRLAEKKGVQYLLPAFKTLHTKHPKARLVIAGDGPMKSTLEKQTATLGLNEFVEFPGYVSGDTKRETIENADIYVVPSIITASGDAEGLPVSLMEGLAYGKICVATNESGADDILTDSLDGYLVPEKNTDALADALTRAFTLSSAKHDAMSRAARDTAQQFSWDHVAHQHIDFLFGVVK